MRKAGIPLCGLLALTVSSCGDGGSTAPPSAPPSVIAKTLYSFGGTSTDAMGPTGVLLRGSDGNFYGTTLTGGLAECGNGIATHDPFFIGCGTVFRITPSGAEAVLYSFAAAPGDGTNPEVLTQGGDGNFYGTTFGGGANNLGTVFRLTPDGVETTLYSFAGGSDGAGGQGLVQGSDGNFYGTTSRGGAGDSGTFFKLTPQGVETVLYSFADASDVAADGAIPSGQLVEGSDGSFYGVTSYGGLMISGTNDLYGGTVFKVTSAGMETVLHRFDGADGVSPVGGLIQGIDGNFYGTTSFGGTVFKITPEGFTTTLYAFSALIYDGVGPLAQLMQRSDGNFYGTASGGGKNEGGAVFRVTPGGVETVLYSFPLFSNFTFSAPSPQTNLVQGSDGNLYGATYYGGAYDRGYFFRLVVN